MARRSRHRDGLLTLFCRHTSASLLIQENAEPGCLHAISRLSSRGSRPRAAAFMSMTTEGPDDMPAHIRAALTQTQLSIPLQERRVLLGTWQGIYLFEHRRAPHRREIVLYLIGE